MSRQVELDRVLEPVPVRESVVQDVRAHAVESMPEECCGLVVGNELERYQRVVRCTNEMTALHLQDPEQWPRNGRTGFFMSPSDVLRVSRDAEEAGLLVSAVYHSHVGAGAYLSDTDLAYAEDMLFPFPAADQIVVGVTGGSAGELGVFRSRSGSFVGHPVRSVEG